MGESDRGWRREAMRERERMRNDGRKRRNSAGLRREGERGSVCAANVQYGVVRIGMCVGWLGQVG